MVWQNTFCLVSLRFLPACTAIEQGTNKFWNWSQIKWEMELLTSVTRPNLAIQIDNPVDFKFWQTTHLTSCLGKFDIKLFHIPSIFNFDESSYLEWIHRGIIWLQTYPMLTSNFWLFDILYWQTWYHSFFWT